MSEDGSDDTFDTAPPTDERIDATNDDGSTALMIAASCGHADVVGVLVGAGANLHVLSGSNGSNVLHLASACGHAPVVEELMMHDRRGRLLRGETAHGATASLLLLTSH